MGGGDGYGIELVVPGDASSAGRVGQE
jgi:hypothetical protein